MSKKSSIVAIDIEKKFEKSIEFIKKPPFFQIKPEKIGFQKSTFEIPEKSLVAILGPSGCGKSTLLKALNGDSPVNTGKVYLNGLELNEENFNFLKTYIGYVPQDDIVHNDLTVEEALMYAAHLRLTESKYLEKKNKVEKVLQKLKIEGIRKNKVEKISGGQRKRVAIAMEILTDPPILFLDEPTSPLDPQTIEEFLNILKALSREGTTVLMVTHKPEDLLYMDKVMFLSVGGHICYYGNVDDYLSYFGVKNVIEVYAMLDENKALPWIQKYQNQEKSAPNHIESQHHKIKDPNFILQFFWLTVRNINLKKNNLFNLIIMLIQAPIIAILLCLIFDKITQAVPFFVAVSAIWFGANNAAKEIVDEQKIYKRERMFNLGIFPYLFAKVSVLGLIALMQACLFTGMLLYRYKTGNLFDYKGVELNDPISMIMWMTYLSVVSSLMGLLISALAKKTEMVMSIIPIVLIPQIMLAGAVVKIKFVLVELFSYLTLSRWGTTGFAKLQEDISMPKSIIKPGTGSNLLTDPPVPIISNKQDTIVNAMQELNKNFLPQSVSAFKDFNQSINLEFLVITALSILFFVSLYYTMKNKDSIEFSN
jgi:ABC-type multidrug transport system ATPase subunit